ncbi:MAG: signal peptidase I [Myxococcota bacterium]|jgi:signal peptidase I
MSNVEDATEGEGEASQGAPARSKGAEIREQITTLVLAVAIALSIRAMLIEPFRIPSGSMFPTLLIGDHLFVNKFIYGAKIPFTDYRLPALREPKRGDVVVFQVARISDRGSSGGIAPSDRRPDGRAEDFVKRIVGVPGDRIEVRDGMLIVNQRPVDTVILDQPFEDDQGNALIRFDETVGECVHAALDDPNRPGLARSPIVIEPGRYFMMGDNRDHSNDSRAWGTVRLDEFKGPAFIIYWSWDSAGNFFHLLNPINWFTVEKRWDRVFQRIGCDTVDEQ